jgi:hypothetical protein
MGIHEPLHEGAAELVEPGGSGYTGTSRPV